MVHVRSGGPKPRKSLGQHFLRDTGILADIANAVRLPDGGVLLEIGAGTGQLTEYLVRRELPVVALEIEGRLVRHLEERFAGAANLTIEQGDARTLVLERTIADGVAYSLVGNLPYFAANPIIRHFLELERQPAEMVIMLQREVAKRILSKPGHLSLLGISVQTYAEPEQLFDVPPEAFDPPPQVWSSVIRLTIRPEPLVPRANLEAYFDLVAGTFVNSRKQLRNARWPGFGRETTLAVLERAAIDPARRPETLSIDEWKALLAARAEVRAG